MAGVDGCRIVQVGPYTLMGLQKQAALAKELDDRLRENLAVVRSAVDQGLRTELDLTAADAASTQAHASLLDLESQVALQKISLNRLLGCRRKKKFCCRIAAIGPRPARRLRPRH